MTERLMEHVRARVPEARIDRQWAAIDQAGLPGPARGGARRGPWLALASGALCAALIALAVLFVGAPDGLPPGALVESAQGEVAVRLEDGSRVQLAPESQLQLSANRPDAVELELRAGSARFEVTHQRARRFAVKAGPAEVRVIGTRFELSRVRTAAGLEVRVAVAEGTVEVARTDQAGSEPHRIQRGETWSVLIPAREPTASPQPVARVAEPAEAAAAAEPADEGAAEAAIAGDSADPTEAIEPAAGARKAGRARRAAGEPAEAGDAAAAEVFRRGNLARRAGRMREAADAYAALLARHPGDARAGLAAFELGRIRMDALDDEAGAIQALERSLTAGPGASFHEDALARIVVAQDALGRNAACTRARERYLAAYPTGVHAHALATRCR
jgi:tetratricopeptide (TPR) repeat protein